MKNADLLEKLLAELRMVVPQTYAALKKEFPDLCGFCICTTAYIEPIVPFYQRTAELPKADHEYYGLKKYYPGEWTGGGDKEFSQAAATARAELEKHSNAASSADGDKIREAFLNGILNLLVDLEKAGDFGPRSDDRYLTMWLAGDDERWILKASERLNAPSVHKAVADAFGG
jgi:hypothetical protein